MTRKQLLVLVCYFLLSMSFVASLPVATLATEDEGWTWTLEDGCLTISGEGEMLYGWRPWEKHHKEITSVVISEGITSISIFAFMSDYDNLTHVVFPKSLETIEDYAFCGCPNLKKVTYCGSRRKLSQLVIKDGNDALQQTRWVQSNGYLLWQAFLATSLSLGAQLLFVFGIIRLVEWRRMKPPKDFSRYRSGADF